MNVHKKASSVCGAEGLVEGSLIATGDEGIIFEPLVNSTKEIDKIPFAVCGVDLANFVASSGNSLCAGYAAFRTVLPKDR